MRYLWLVVVCICAFFVSADSLQTDIMESRNLVTAHEMVEYDNWLVPTMNGELRLEKPPLPTWVAGAIDVVAPDSLTAQRAAAGVMGTLWAVFFFLTVKAISRRDDAAFLCTLVFLTCYNVVLMGRTATWDIYCHAFMQGAVWLIFKLFYSPRTGGTGGRLWQFAAAGLLMGLSFLSKGPVSFFALLLPFLIACAFYGRPTARKTAGGIVLMIVVMVAVSAWWYVYIYVFHQDLATAVLHKESGSWINHNVRPWYYYWRYFAETGVWALLTLAALLAPLFFRTVRRQKAFTFAVIWMLVSVILLSFMPEKKMRYLLPVMAPAAMSVGMLLMIIAREWRRFRAGRVIFRINGWLVTVITVCLAAGVIYCWLGLEKISGVLAVIIAVLMVLDAVWMGYSTARGRVVSFVDAVAVLFLIAECFLMDPITHFFVNPQGRPISEVRRDARLRDIPFYILSEEQPRMEIVLGAGRRILPVSAAETDSLPAKTPCALLTQKPLSLSLPKAVLERVDTLYIGTYDDNRHPRTDRHYNPKMVNRVTLLTPKKL